MELLYWIIPDFLSGMSVPQRGDVARLIDLGIKAVISLLDDAEIRKGDTHDFSPYEFVGPFSVGKLCGTIMSAHGNLSLTGEENSIDWLNELLCIPDFYEQAIKKRVTDNSPDEVNELVSITEKLRNQIYTNLSSYEQRMVRKLNRLLLETLYPDITPHVLQVKCLLKNAGIDFLHLPVAPLTPPTKGQTDKFIEYVENMKSRKKPVAVHCQFGKGRTGTMLAAYLIYCGDDFETAFQKIRKVNPYAIESMSQLTFLNNLRWTK